ncbi:hypothetical protein M378DRAFT_19176 [Amanita muscaria Koide BX008]|uniref:CCHC-type domain-containing protein n=1 Tax=Amanita muscaria (strain Koide BX008) TaxID=946122 RepID=A0A0C2RV69_AMAMK|nr:hypothetical protein M378DRAFT_19176 [Amanita muscaria Koide BX008]
MEDVKEKGKKVDPAEKGPLYEKLHSKSSRKKANLKNKRTEDRPLHERLHEATKGRDATKKSRKSVPAFVSPGPSRFRRDASEKPGGGWFRATTKKSDMESSEISSEGSGGDDTDSPPSSSDSPKGSSPSSSSSSSESSESSQANRRRHEKRRRHQRKSKKSKQKLRDIKKPFVWDGTPNLDTFDRWIYEVDTWCELVRIDDGDAVKILVQFMSGEAAKFFMKHVAMNRTKWTTKSIYEGLFDYCFPPRFKQQLRRKMVTARQGTQRVRDYARELESMAMRFPDVTEREVRDILWHGMNTYIRVHLIGKGLGPERTPLERLIKHAHRHEEAMDALKAEENAWKGKPTGRNWGRFENRVDGPKPAKQDREDTKVPENREAKSTAQPSQKNEERKNSPQAQNCPNGGFSKRREPRSKWSKEEHEQLRAEGRCFSCKGEGHVSRNCPNRRQAKAPTLMAGAVNIAELEAKGQRAQEAELTVGVVGCVSDSEDLEGVPESVCDDSEETEPYPEGASEIESFEDGPDDGEWYEFWGKDISTEDWLQEEFEYLGKYHEGWSNEPSFSVDVNPIEVGYLRWRSYVVRKSLSDEPHY